MKTSLIIFGQVLLFVNFFLSFFFTFVEHVAGCKCIVSMLFIFKANPEITIIKLIRSQDTDQQSKDGKHRHICNHKQQHRHRYCITMDVNLDRKNRECEKCNEPKEHDHTFARYQTNDRTRGGARLKTQVYCKQKAHGLN